MSSQVIWVIFRIKLPKLETLKKPIRPSFKVYNNIRDRNPWRFLRQMIVVNNLCWFYSLFSQFALLLKKKVEWKMAGTYTKKDFGPGPEEQTLLKDVNGARILPSKGMKYELIFSDFMAMLLHIFLFSPGLSLRHFFQRLLFFTASFSFLLFFYWKLYKLFRSRPTLRSCRFFACKKICLTGFFFLWKNVILCCGMCKSTCGNMQFCTLYFHLGSMRVTWSGLGTRL